LSFWPDNDTDATASATATQGIAEWIRGRPVPKRLSPAAFDRALSDAREDLTPHRRELLRLILFAPDEEWDRAIVEVHRFARLLRKRRRPAKLVARLEHIAWALEGDSSAHDADHSSFDRELPAGWRLGVLTEVARLSAPAAARVEEVTQARAAVATATEGIVADTRKGTGAPALGGDPRSWRLVRRSRSTARRIINDRRTIPASIGSIFLLAVPFFGALGSWWARFGVLTAWVSAIALGTVRDRNLWLRSLLSFSPAPASRLTASEFGAKPSLLVSDSGDTPYIRRERLDRELDAALLTHRFVVVTGLTNAGKTRSAYEAIRRVLPKVPILMPHAPRSGPDPLSELMRHPWLVPNHESHVLVVNDLETRMAGLTMFRLRRWLHLHPRARIVATLSAERWQDLATGKPTPMNKMAARLLSEPDVRRIQVDVNFEPAALREARIRYRHLPEGQSRVGSYLASADRLIAAFTAAPPAAQALAMAGVDSARAGVVRPVPLASLQAMAGRINQQSRNPFRDEDWAAAAEYCLSGTGSRPPIFEASVTDSGATCVSVSSVLVELVDYQGGRHDPRAPLRPQVWDASLELVANGPDDWLTIAAAADRRGRVDLSTQLLERAQSVNRGTAAELAGMALGEPLRDGEAPEVTELLERVSEQGRLQEAPARSALRPAEGDDMFVPAARRSPRAHAYYRRAMLRDAARVALLLTCDIASVGLGIKAAVELNTLTLDAPEHLQGSLPIAAVSAAVVIVFFLFFRLYRSDVERAQLAEIIKGTALAGLCLSLFAVGSQRSLVTVPFVSVAGGVATTLCFCARWLYDHWSRGWVIANGLQSRVLLVASDSPHQDALLVTSSSRRPIQMVGYIGRRAGPGWLGSIAQLRAVTSSYEIDRVILADPAMSPQERLAIIFRCHAMGLATEVVPGAPELFQGASDALDDIVVPLINVRPLFLNYVGQRTKRLMDLAIAIPLSVVAILALGPVILAMKLRRRGERVLVREYLPGLGAVPFGMWRLRTRRGGLQTRTGKVLARWRADEVPQLLNVLRGTMAMVGPRPLTTGEFEELDMFSRGRYAVLPGITGLWQIARRKTTSLADMSSLDIVYCRRWTLLLDLTILLRTVPAVFARNPDVRSQSEVAGPGERP
jgi:lipopolysaccharide/colanic/teichoic acid biosynthesis glycosyltransferase